MWSKKEYPEKPEKNKTTKNKSDYYDVPTSHDSQAKMT